MRIARRKKIDPSREREELLRKARAAAQTIRAAFPGATRVNVQLQFLCTAAPFHAAQSFVLYPAARAFFEYPCPYGDCDGIYDLAAAAGQVLTGEKLEVTGIVECSGVRSRNGLQRQPCGLRMSYMISVQHELERAVL